MISELMDSVGQTRVRTGVIEAQIPQIIKPEAYSEIDFDGFSEDAEKEAQKLFDWLKKKGHNLAFLKYGFEFKKRETKSEVVHEPVESVVGKVKEQSDRNNDPSLAILQGVDDTWEVSLLKFTIKMIERSKDVNVTDYKRSGLL